MLSPLFASFDRDKCSGRNQRKSFSDAVRVTVCEAVDFIEFIAQRTQQRATQPAPNATAGRPAYKSVLGALEHLNVPISLEDLAEVRREMWANFPREDPRE